MEERRFQAERLCCFMIATNFLEDLKQPPTLNKIMLLSTVLVFTILRQKCAPKTLALIIAYLLDVSFALTENTYFFVAAAIFCLLHIFLPWRVYELPPVPADVGYKRITGQFGLMDACMFYPTCKGAATTEVKWLIPSQIESMRQDDDNPVKLPLPLFSFFVGYLQNYKLVFSSGGLSETVDEVIVFSHGLNANIHAYSALLTRLVSNHRLVLCVQHRQNPSFSGMPMIERRKEMIARAQDVLDAYDLIQNETEMRRFLGQSYRIPNHVTLMGHSYGGGTVIQASSMLQGRKIKTVVALDPWMEPCSQQVIESTTNSSILVVETEYFTKDPKLSNHNQTFFKYNTSNCLRYNLKQADHMHQCDMCFTLGSLFGVVKHPESSMKWLLVNQQIVDRYLKAIDQDCPLAEIDVVVRAEWGSVMNPATQAEEVQKKLV